MHERENISVNQANRQRTKPLDNKLQRQKLNNEIAQQGKPIMYPTSLITMKIVTIKNN